MNTFIDQTGHPIKLKDKPKRIVSLVPSQSEFLWDIGSGAELVGITKFCIYPQKMYNTVERVGGTKKLDIDKIRKLKPDLIIGNKEENEKVQIEALRKEFPVWLSDIYNLDDAFQMMQKIGEMTDKGIEAQKCINAISQSFSELKSSFLGGKKAAYFIWYNPLMAAASNTFIDVMMKKIGLINVFKDLERYPEIANQDLEEARPDVILLSSEPFPFSQKHINVFKAICPQAKIALVDGEMFSWYGSRLKMAPAYFKSLQLDLNS